MAAWHGKLFWEASAVRRPSWSCSCALPVSPPARGPERKVGVARALLDSQEICRKCAVQNPMKRQLGKRQGMDSMRVSIQVHFQPRWHLRWGLDFT